MRLCDEDILAELENGRIKVEPAAEESALGAVTLDLRLGDKFRTFSSHQTPFLDLSGDREQVAAAIGRVMSDEIFIGPDEHFILHPGELALGVTLEKLSLPDDIVGWLDGRSSLARLGLMVHVTAHRIDPGWNGNIVLEFFNSGKLPLALRPGMSIGAVSFERLTGPATRSYSRRASSKYRDQTGPMSSQIDKD